ncbi:Sulfotransferase domain [Trinorchestia longiramus]|nr:Sulfotransferase domain [Trinorchestia longiramus]
MSSRRRTLFVSLVFLVLLCCLYTVNRPLLSSFPGITPVVPSSNSNKPRWSYHRDSYVDIASPSGIHSTSRQGYIRKKVFGVDTNKVNGEGRNRTSIYEDLPFVDGGRPRYDRRGTVRKVTSTESIGGGKNTSLKPSGKIKSNLVAAEKQSRFHGFQAVREKSSVGKASGTQFAYAFSGGNGLNGSSNPVQPENKGGSNGVQKRKISEEKSIDAYLSSELEYLQHDVTAQDKMTPSEENHTQFLLSGNSSAFSTQLVASSAKSSAYLDKPHSTKNSQTTASSRREHHSKSTDKNTQSLHDENRLFSTKLPPEQLIPITLHDTHHLATHLPRSAPLSTPTLIATQSTADSVEEEYGDESYVDARHEKDDPSEAGEYELDGTAAMYKDKLAVLPVVETRVNESQGVITVSCCRCYHCLLLQVLSLPPAAGVITASCCRCSHCLLLQVFSLPPAAGVRHLPDVLIIGAKKCGTRALLEFLRLHPRVRAARQEVHFFDRHYHRGVRWYSKRNSSRHTFTELVFSDKATGLVNVNWGPVAGGLYARHLQRWLHYFPPSIIHVVSGERLVAHPAAEMQLVEKFLNLPPFISSHHFYFNKTKGFPCIVRDPAVLREGHVSSPNYKLSHPRQAAPTAATRQEQNPESPLTKLSLKDVLNNRGTYEAENTDQESSKDGDTNASSDTFIKSKDGHKKSSSDVYKSPSSPRYKEVNAFKASSSQSFKSPAAEDHNFVNTSLHPRCLGSSKGREHPDVDQETFRILQEFYRPFNHKFFRIIHKKFNWG